MKKTVVLPAASVMLCIFMLAGCASLSGAYESDMAHATPTATVDAVPVTTMTIPTPTRIPLPASTAILTPSPAITPTPAIRGEERFSMDLDGDGRDETILIYSIVYDEFFEDVWLRVVTNNEYDRILVFEGYFVCAYITQTQSGEPCVMVSCGSEVFYIYTATCSFSGTKPMLKSTSYGCVDDVEGTVVMMSGVTDEIGSWDYTQEYKLTNDFELLPISDMMLDIEERDPLITTREVPVEMWEDGAYVEGTLPADTSILPVSADGEGHMTFKLKTAGREGSPIRGTMMMTTGTPR